MLKLTNRIEKFTPLVEYETYIKLLLMFLNVQYVILSSALKLFLNDVRHIFKFNLAVSVLSRL